ncbi:MAG: NAD(P)/FAD-dependent oxidoreductase [Anaerostipes sp.]|jgi:protoporphyrinogen oxidase
MEKIIIIGAGPAGLTAAYELSKLKYKVTVLEEENQVGGLSKTVSYHGNRMDLGGHRFFSKNKKVNRWWQSFLPLENKENHPENTDNVMLIQNRVSRIYYNKHFFDYPISLKMKTLRAMGWKKIIKIGCSYLKSVVHKLPENSLENFYINRFGKELYQMFFEDYTEKLWGKHPRDLSADWGEQRVKGLSVLAVLKNFIIPSKEKETSLIDSFWYPKYGPGQLWEKVEASILEMGGNIIKGAKVSDIFQEHNQIKSVTYKDCKGEMQKIKGDIFLSSMPLKDLVYGMNQVPKGIQKIAHGLVYRDFVTIGICLSKWQLSNQSLIPDCWMYIQDKGVKLGRIQVFYNWSPYLIKDAKHKLWIGSEYFCDEGDAFWNLTEDECLKFAMKELHKIGIVSKNSRVLDYHREKVKKAYPSYVGTYNQLPRLIHYINRRENLYCIGRNGQHRYNNMDHSMMTAFEAVDNLTGKKKDKTSIWSVNTEREYLEESHER